MCNKSNLEDELKNLKLTKRSFVLEGKNTESVDVKIKIVEDKLKDAMSKNNKDNNENK